MLLSASFVQLVSGAGNENENGLAAERGKLGGAGSVRDTCGFGPDKAHRHVVRCSWHAPYPDSLPAKLGKLTFADRSWGNEALELPVADGQEQAPTKVFVGSVGETTLFCITFFLAPLLRRLARQRRLKHLA